MSSGRWFGLGVAAGLGIGILAFGVWHLVVAVFFICIGVVATILVGRRAFRRETDEPSA